MSAGALSEVLIGEFIDAVVNAPEQAETLLAQNPALLDSRWLHQETVLHFLAVENYPDGVEWLARHGADVNATNAFGDSALVDVATIGNEPMVRLLLEHGADPNASSQTRGSPLVVAVERGSLELMSLLLDRGARLPTSGDLVPLQLALALCPRNREEILARLREIDPGLKAAFED